MFKKLILALMILCGVVMWIEAVDTANTIVTDPNGYHVAVPWGNSGYAIKVSSNGEMSVIGGITDNILNSMYGLFTSTDPNNGFIIYLDTNTTVNMSTITVSDDRYINKTSSGVFGFVTGVTTYTLSVTQNVSSWKIKYKNLSDVSQYMKLNTTYMGLTSQLCNEEYDNDVLDQPKASDFILTDLSVSATTQIRVNFLQNK